MRSESFGQLFVCKCGVGHYNIVTRSGAPFDEQLEATVSVLTDFGVDISNDKDKVRWLQDSREPKFVDRAVTFLYNVFCGRIFVCV